MIISQTPLRISLAGGGTDAPSFYEHTPGFVLSAAINKFVYIGINSTFTNDYLLKYSSMERVERIDQVSHPILREALDLAGIEPGVEIVSVADIPAGTGLGSSGSFTVGLLRALFAYRHQHSDPSELAAYAAHIEIELLKEPVGKQDPYIAAYGGLTCFDFLPGGAVEVNRLAVSEKTLHDLEDNLVLFFTGYSGAASSVPNVQVGNTDKHDAVMRASATETTEIAFRIKKALEDGETLEFAKIMHEHWKLERNRTPGVSNPTIDHWYEIGLAHGAAGGKLVGSSSGGFLLFYATDLPRLRAAMSVEGLREVRFEFAQDGSTVRVRS